MITTATFVERKTHADIAREWDAIASLRARQISSGEDLSFHYVLKPAVLELLAECNTSNVLDVGCGTGELSQILAQRCDSVTGIDISRESIRLAKINANSFDNLNYQVQSAEDFARSHRTELFTAAVANMVLATVTNLRQFFQASANLLRPRGKLVFTIPHPCFWPRYWEYEDADWFDYKAELFIEAPFRISRHPFSDFTTTHVHRPLEMYVQELTAAGFVLETLHEPMPPYEVEDQYPAPWAFPRFLAGRCRLERF